METPCENEETHRHNEQTTREQFTILVEFMCAHSDLATGKLKGLAGKERSNALWKRLTASLNSTGGPIRSVDKWKKVWSDFKTHLKKKLRNNKHNMMGTGGGPSRYVPLSPLEEQVAQLLSYDGTTDGVPSLRFGSTLLVETENIPPASSSPPKKSTNVDDEPGACTNDSKYPYDMTASSTSTMRNTLRSKKNYTSLLEMQVQNQISYQENSIEMLKQINQNLATLTRQNKQRFKLDLLKYQMEKKKFNLKKRDIVIRQKKKI